MRGRVVSLTLLAVVVSIRLAGAHHSFSAVYDSKRSVTRTRSLCFDRHPV